MLNTKSIINLPISSSLQQTQLGLDRETRIVDAILARVDIIAAIDYYGITELLDNIGEEHLRSHLESL